MKDLIRRNEKLYYACKLISRSRDKWFRSKVFDIDKQNNNVQLNSYGTLNEGQVIYIINYNKTKSGFFAVLNFICKYLMFADKFSLVPVVKISKDWIFSNGESENPFCDFFMQPSGISYEEALKSKCVTYFDYKHITGEIYEYDEKYIENIALVFKKYIKWNKTVLNMIENDEKEVFGDGNKILGIHVRGSDFKKSFNKHPSFVPVEEYYRKLEQVIDNYDKVFLATDDQEYLEYFEEKLEDKVVCYKDCLRSDSDVSPSFIKLERSNHEFRLAYEVIRDAVTLSRCSGFIGSKSLVSMFAQVMKIANGGVYVDKIVVDKGINNNRNTIDKYEMVSDNK